MRSNSNKSQFTQFQKGVTMKTFTFFAVLAVALVAVFATTVQAAVGSYPYSYGWAGAPSYTGDGNWSSWVNGGNNWALSPTGGNNDNLECVWLSAFKNTGNSSQLRLAVNLTGKTLDGTELFSFYITRVTTGGGNATINLRYSLNGGTSWVTFTNGSFSLNTKVPTAGTYELASVNFPTGTTLDNNANAMVCVEVIPLSNGSKFDDILVDDGAIEGGALPIQLASFTGTVVNGNNVQLDWMTVTEVNNYGFFVQRRLQGDPNFTEIPNSFVPGHGTTLEPQYYSWTHQTVAPGSYEYRLRQVDLNGAQSFTQPVPIVIESPTGVGNGSTVPAVFKLEQNYPNPFNPSTKISFSLAEPNFTTLKLYNLLGQEVATLFNGMADAGRAYVINLDASNLGNGVYFYRLESGSKVDVRKMTLLK